LGGKKRTERLAHSGSDPGGVLTFSVQAWPLGETGKKKNSPGQKVGEYHAIGKGRVKWFTQQGEGSFFPD